MGGAISWIKEEVFDPIMDIVMMPVNMLMGTVSGAAKESIGLITDVVDETGIGDLASSAINSIGGAAGGILDTGENIIQGGADSIFGTLDVMKYIPYVAVGFLGIFGLKYGSQLISESGSTFRATRGVR